MKKIYLIASIFIFGCSDKKNTDLYSYELKGKVKLIVENSFEPEVKFGEIKKGKNLNGYGCRDYTLIFNKLGKKIQEKNTCFAHQIEYIYDDNNNLELKNSFDINKKLIFQEMFKYDINANCIETSYYKNHKLVGLKKFNYDKNKNLIEENKYDAYGKLDEKTKNVYKDNNLIKAMTYTGNGDLNYYIENIYDENKNLTETMMYLGNGSIQEKNSYKYDENNYIIERIQLRNYLDNSIVKWRFIYKFDKNKNWIQKIVFHDDSTIPGQLEERRIEYY